ncbi:transcriptional regulator with XRE-family HTH domain [Nocardiopsis mwathae]|uniref:Transcriptional regulator with XRE-family HTH domain n=1 Tax=Nocardiopsis mwathae TaxID=1472723 RepID=A0A7W9YKY3_9ACTN|nr:helix-turn-helix transcriptional regulator [Nocardiopsis mwathae]MBB6174068.1 transcriptional regulator with XRE-family HTH domain [Nocardiopsis mwathae]
MAARQPVMPTVGKRQLARELRSAREAAQLTMDQVAEQLDWSKGKVHNIETGRWTRGNLTDLRALLDTYGVNDPAKREALEQLMRDAKKPGWWSKYNDAFGSALPAFEDEASELFSYEPSLVPGLLQSPEYITELMRNSPLLTAEEAQRKCEARQRRQKVLTRSSPLVARFVVEEAALQRLVNLPEVFRPQVEHLIAMGEDDGNRVTIQVMPLRSGLHAVLGPSFVILDFHDELDLSIVYTESVARGAYLEEKAEVSMYRALFARACEQALRPDESIALLKDLLKQ